MKTLELLTVALQAPMLYKIVEGWSFRTQHQRMTTPLFSGTKGILLIILCKMIPMKSKRLNLASVRKTKKVKGLERVFRSSTWIKRTIKAWMNRVSFIRKIVVQRWNTMILLSVEIEVPSWRASLRLNKQQTQRFYLQEVFHWSPQICFQIYNQDPRELHLKWTFQRTTSIKKKCYPKLKRGLDLTHLVTTNAKTYLTYLKVSICPTTTLFSLLVTSI